MAAGEIVVGSAAVLTIVPMVESGTTVEVTTDTAPIEMTEAMTEVTIPVTTTEAMTEATTAAMSARGEATAAAAAGKEWMCVTTAETSATMLTNVPGRNVNINQF